MLRILQAIPTLLVLVLLGAVAFVGHETGWKLPKVTELFGTSAPETDDWCKDHSVPESICVECQKNLLPPAPNYGFCKVHGVHNCLWEHPHLAHVDNTSVAVSDLAQTKFALDLKERPENNPQCKLNERRIQLSSREWLDKLGIDVRPAAQQPITEGVSVTGEIDYDLTRVAPVNVSVPGRIVHLTPLGRVGARVQAGDVLGVLESIEVGKAKTEFMSALGTLDVRQRQLDMLKRIGPDLEPTAKLREAESALLQAEIAVAAAVQVLQNFGLTVQPAVWRNLAPSDVIARLQWLGIPDSLRLQLGNAPSSNFLVIRSPRTGEVTQSRVVPGEMTDASRPLFTVIDPERMALQLNVPLEETKLLNVGQKVLFQPDGASFRLMGDLAWIDTAADDKTRTVRVRVDLDNSQRKLRAHTFGLGTIILRESPKAIVVPNESIHWEGCCHVVFVRDKRFFETGAPKVFHVRTVRLGVKNREHTEILAGLLPGEVIATRNSAVLRAELLRANLGEG